MKPILLFCLFLIMISSPKPAYAGNAGGAELLYQWLHDSTYQVFYKFYRDCSGPAEPDSVIACYKNSCNSFSDTINLHKVTSLIPPGVNPNVMVSFYCPNVQTTCTDPASVFPGYWEQWYSGNVTLASRCNYWTFSVSVFSRSASIANLVNPASHYLYTEATLDNLDAQGNTSPFFSIKPFYYGCSNTLLTYNSGAYDINNDSLDFTLINPLSGAGCPSNDSMISFQAASPAYNLNNVNGNPLQCNNTFNLNSVTGLISFTPSIAQTGAIAIRVDEYRNHIKIGSVMRDMQMVVGNCNYGPPVILLSNINNGYFSSASHDTIITTAGANVSFDIATHGVPISDSVILINGGTGGGAANAVYVAANNTHGRFSWEPSIGDTGFVIINISSEDTNCAANNATITGTDYVVIKVLPSLYDMPPCYTGTEGGSIDSSDIGMFSVGPYHFGTGGTQLNNILANNRYAIAADTMTLYTDSSYIVSVSETINTPNDADAKVTLFIDYNNNLQYDIPNERAWLTYIHTGQDTPRVILRVPSYYVTPNIPVHMRLILNNDIGPSAASDSACGPYISGETEDFIVIFRNAVTSVKSVGSTGNISFLPNPSTGKFIMKMNRGNDVSQLNLNVMSVTGQKVYSKTYQDVYSQFSATIDLSAMPKGLYFVETVADGEKQLSKIIIE